MTRPRFSFLLVSFHLCITIGLGQVKLARVPGEPGELDISAGLAFTSDGTSGFLSNPGSGEIQRFRPSTGEVISSLTLPAGAGPLALSSNGRILVVLGVKTQKVYVIDVADPAKMVLRTEDGIGYARSGFTYLNNIVMSRDGVHAYIADPSKNQLAVFNTSLGTLERIIQVGINPNILTPFPDGNQFAVLCSGKRSTDDESIYLINMQTIGIVDNPILRGAKTQAFNNIQTSANGAYLYVASNQDSRIITYDLRSRIIGSRTIGGKGPARVVSSPNGRWLAVVNATSDNIDLLAIPEGHLVKTIELEGVDLTNDTVVAFSGDSHTLYIPVPGGDQIIAYDMENLRVLKRISTGDGPARLALSGDARVLTSLDLGSNELSLIVTNPVSRLIPHLVQSARDYAGLAMANFGTEPENVTLFARNNSGELLPGTSNPRIVTLPAGQQTALVMAQTFGLDPKSEFEGYIEAYTLGSDVSILYLTGSNAQNDLDGFMADSAVGKLLGFGRIDEGMSKFGSTTSTEIILLNPNEAEANLVVRMFTRTLQGPASLVAYASKKLAAHSRIRQPVSEYVKTPFYPLDKAYLEITSDIPIKGMEIVRIGDSKSVIPAAIRGESQTEYLAVHFVTGGAGVLDTPIFSSLSLTNAGSAELTVMAEVTDSDGNLLLPDTMPVEFVLAPHETTSGGADAILGFPDPLTDPEIFQGTLRLTTAGSSLIPTLLYGDAREGKYLTQAGLQFQQGKTLALAHFAEGLFGDPPKGLFTGLAIYNPSRTRANITVEVFSPLGISLGKANLVLSSGARVSKTIGELVPNSVNNTGTVIVTSSVPIVLFEVFGSSTSDFLVSVPPVILAQ